MRKSNIKKTKKTKIIKTKQTQKNNSITNTKNVKIKNYKNKKKSLIKEIKKNNKLYKNKFKTYKNKIITINKRIYTEYTDYINNIVVVDSKLWNFKRESVYTDILEHILPYHGQLYFTEIKKHFYNFYKKYNKLLIKLCDKNDLYGNPRKIKFKNFTKCSSTNLRYILHSLLILTFMNKNNITKIDIIEIGGGYGGLAFFLQNISKIFNIDISSYTIFDLPDISKLQHIYLKTLNSDKIMNFYQIDNFKNLKKNSFLIANYSYSEIALKLQKEYTEKILNPYISYGFLVWNFIPLYNFIDNKHIVLEIEYPDTSKRYPDSISINPNYYVTFNPIIE